MRARSFMPPGPDTEPRELLRWSRRAEILGGVGCIAGALLLWDVEWARWTLLGLGALAFLPWPGPAAVLRRAERDPSVLESDPARGRARARKTALVLVPLMLVAGAVAGYIIDGVGAAIFIGGLMGASAALGAWQFLRQL